MSNIVSGSSIRYVSGQKISGGKDRSVHGGITHLSLIYTVGQIPEKRWKLGKPYCLPQMFKRDVLWIFWIGVTPKRPAGRQSEENFSKQLIYFNPLSNHATMYKDIYWTIFQFVAHCYLKASNGTCICIYYDYNFISRSEAIHIGRLLEKYYVDSFVPLLAKNVYFSST